MTNLQPGDIVVFGEGADAAVGRVLSIGYPLSAIHFGTGSGVPVFTGGITKRATPEEAKAFEARTKGEPND